MATEDPKKKKKPADTEETEEQPPPLPIPSEPPPGSNPMYDNGNAFGYGDQAEQFEFQNEEGGQIPPPPPPGGGPTQVDPSTVGSPLPPGGGEVVDGGDSDPGTDGGGGTGGPSGPSGGGGGGIWSGGGEGERSGRDFGFGEDLADYARDWLSSPSAWDSDMMQQQMDVIRSRMEELRKEATERSLSDQARRGIYDTTHGQELSDELRGDLSRYEGQMMADLAKEQASAYDRGRQAAFGAALGTAQFGESQYQFDTNVALQQRALALQKYGIDQQTATAMARLELDASQFDRQLDFNKWNTEQQLQYQKDRDAAINEIEWKKLDYMQQGMDDDQARWQAEMDFRKDWAERNFNYQADRDKQNTALSILSLIGVGGMTKEEVHALLRRYGFGEYLEGLPDPTGTGGNTENTGSTNNYGYGYDDERDKREGEY